MKKLVSVWLIIFIILFETSSIVYADDIRLDVKFPFDLNNKQGVALTGSEISAYFLLENLKNKKIATTIKILLPPEIQPYKVGSSWRIEKQGKLSCLVSDMELATKLDNWFDLLTFKVLPGTQPGIYPVEIITVSNGQTLKKIIPVEIADRKTMQKLIGINRLHIPTDKDGKIDGRYKENTLILRESSPNLVSNALVGRKTIQTDAGMDIMPIAYLGLEVFNRSSQEVSVQLTAQLLDPHSRKAVAGFSLPNQDNSIKPDNKIYALVVLHPGETRIPLALYGEVGQIKGGEYILSANLKLLGSEEILAVKEVPIQVVEKDPWPARIVLGSFWAIILSMALILRQQRKVLTGFKTRWLILIALFGTATFVTVNIPGTILMDLAHALLGPFNFLLTGLFNQVILYMLLLSLLVLIPKPGTVFLLTTVRFLLNGIVLGHFNPINFLSYFSGALLLELILYLAGFTRNSYWQREITDSTEKAITINIFFLALACGFAEIATSYLNFQSYIFLYRLYYAQWYIVMYLLVDALFYTMLGTVLGIMLGRQLKKVTTD